VLKSDKIPLDLNYLEVFASNGNSQVNSWTSAVKSWWKAWENRWKAQKSTWKS